MVGQWTRIVAVVALTFMAGDVRGQFFRSWSNSSGGSYASPFNWSPAGVPDADDGAGFALNSTYTVTFINNQTTGVVTVSNGSVTFDLDASGTARVLTVPGTLTVRNGTGTLQVRDGFVNAGSILVEDGGLLSGAATATIAAHDGDVTVRGSGSVFRTLNGFLRVGDAADGTLTIQDGGMVLNSDGSAIGRLVTGAGITTVSGNGSLMDIAATLTIGQEGTGTLLIEDGGDVENVLGRVAFGTDAVGAITVTGEDSTWTNEGELRVGESGEGTLLIEAGGNVSNTMGSIGLNAGSSGMAAISGASSTWANEDMLDVGSSGTGELVISDGGSVTNTMGRIGREVGSEGTVTVTGSGSTWINNSELRIGNMGIGEMTVSGGANVSNTVGRIARQADSTGTVTVTGPGSTWTNSGELRVGESGEGTLSIEAGGSVSNANGLIGDVTGTGMVTVADPGSTWTNDGILIVGDGETFGDQSGADGTLTIEAGGTVSSTTGRIGGSSLSTGMVTVTGAGSTWTNSGNLTVGSQGEGTLRIEAGGFVSSAVSTLGFSGTAGGHAIVTGAGSMWDLQPNSLTVGQNGPGTLTIEAGGTVLSGVTLIAFSTGSSGSSVVVNGNGSTWTNSGDLVVGREENGSLQIISGASVSSFGGVIGRGDNSVSEVEVSGINATWTIADRLSIGGDADSGTNGGAGTLTIQFRGTVTVAEDTVLFPDGVLNLRENSEFATTAISFNSGGLFDWTGGTLHVGVFHGDLINPASGTLAPGRSAGGTAILGDYTQQVGATLQIEVGGLAAATEHDFVDVNGTAVLSGLLELVLIDNLLPEPTDEFVVLNSDDLSGFFSNAGNGQRVETVDGLGSFVVHYGPTSAFNPNQIVLTDFELVGLPGDYNQNGTVDATDYVLWRDNLGAAAGTLPNDPVGRPIGQAQYNTWVANFGASAGFGSKLAGAAVPEPQTWLLLATALAGLGVKWWASGFGSSLKTYICNA